MCPTAQKGICTWDISCEEGAAAAARRDMGITGVDARVHVGTHEMPGLRDLVDGMKLSREDFSPSPGVWVLQHPHPLYPHQTLHASTHCCQQAFIHYQPESST